MSNSNDGEAQKPRTMLVGDEILTEVPDEEGENNEMILNENEEEEEDSEEDGMEEDNENGLEEIVEMWKILKIFLYLHSLSTQIVYMLSR